MRVRPRSRLITAAPLVVALVALGCVAAPRDTGTRPLPPAAAEPGQDGTGDATEDGTDTVEEFRRDIAGAQAQAEQYWSATLAASDIEFEPVREVIAYTEEGEVECGGQPIGLKNAAYCSDGDFVAYDIAWAYSAFRQIGDAFIFYLLGHEYAHAIQVRLGIRKQFTIQQELQADCMAGAYLGDSERAGKLQVQDGDIAEFRRGLRAVGDDPGQPWFAEGSHGTARQRTQAFVNGY